jgi:hypothetical protein
MSSTEPAAAEAAAFRPGDIVLHGNAAARVIRRGADGLWEIRAGGGTTLVPASELRLFKLEV